MLRDRARSKAWYCLYETMEDDLILLLTCALPSLSDEILSYKWIHEHLLRTIWT